MGASARKDYGSGAIIPENNETMKAINWINSPYSIQATGHDKVKENLIPITSANLDTLAVNTRVLLGNTQGYVKTVTDTPGPPLVSAVITVLDKDKNEIDTTYLKAELLALGNLFLVNP